MQRLGTRCIIAAGLSCMSLVLTSGAPPSDVGQAKAGAAGVRLPGSQEDLVGSVRWSQMIAIVDGVEMGRTKPDFPDKSYYDDVKLNVKASLTGKAPKELSTSVMVRTAPADMAEAIPISIDKAYVFILEAPGQRTIKVLQANREEIRATTEALRRVEDRLPGSGLSVREAALKSQVIVVARVIAMGPLKPSDPGSATYAAAKMEAVRFLKGRVGVEFSPSVSFRSWPPDKAEATPKIGREYLLFIEVPDPEQLWTVKVTRAAEEDLRAAEEAVKAEKP